MKHKYYEDHKEFFEDVATHILYLKDLTGSPRPTTVDELYRHFKARLLDELMEARWVKGQLGSGDQQ